MPFIVSNPQEEEKMLQELLLNSEEARTAYDKYRQQFELQKALVQARKAANLTQSELSRNTGLSQQAISRIEKGQNVTIQSILRYLEGVGCAISIIPKGKGSKATL